MTKTLLAFLAIAASGTILAACSSPSTVTTREGRVDYTADAPDTDRDDGFVTYQKNGQEVKVNKHDVQRIEEVN